MIDEALRVALRCSTAIEESVNGHPKRLSNREQRRDRWTRLPSLYLTYEAGRNARCAGKFSNPHSTGAAYCCEICTDAVGSRLAFLLSGLRRLTAVRIRSTRKRGDFLVVFSDF